ncbi:MAG: hypothetical protein C5B49_16660 [Bdellovibrio sp.]|nr:MAG: hypothetical protein C5B49_16660 [Bdellovibrio sp.]
MKKLLVTAIVLTSSFIALAEDAPKTGGATPAKGHPCKEKKVSKHEARMNLNQCIEAWSHDFKDADPSDDCSAKLQAFIAAAKDVKACFAEMKKQ